MLKTFLDKHKGKIAFVLGAGPSLRKVNTELLKPHIVIAVNNSILKVPFAQYFFSCDSKSTLYKSWLTLKNLKCMLIVCCKTGGGMGAYNNRTGVNAFEGIISERIFYFDRKSNWIIEKSDKLIKGISSVHCAVHFAYILGCSPIVLLGCDCRFENGKAYHCDFSNEFEEGLIKPEYRNFITIDRYGTDGAGILSGIAKGWKSMRRQNPNVNIINASGGSLDVFPRMSLKDILKKY